MNYQNGQSFDDVSFGRRQTLASSNVHCLPSLPIFIPTTIAITGGFVLGVTCGQEIASVSSFLTLVDAIMPLYAVLALSFVWDIQYTRKLSDVFLEWCARDKLTTLSVKSDEDSTTSSTPDVENKDSLDIPYEVLPIKHPSQRINFTGTYKFKEAKNMNAILTAEGCTWVKKTIILNLKDLVQGIEHVPDEDKFTLYRRSSVVPNKTYYYLFGGKIVTEKQDTGRIYLVTCEYTNVGVKIICNDSKGDYVLVFSYVLSNSYPQLLVMYLDLSFPDGRSIKAQRIFERISFNHDGS